MKLRWTIVYVPDVEATMAFYEKAFGLERRFVSEEGGYGEMETGETRIGSVCRPQELGRRHRRRRDTDQLK